MEASVQALPGVLLTPVKRIAHPSGDILHALKASEASFAGFGEAYFSSVHQGVTKGWKKHTRMIMNLVVPVGAIRFILVDDRAGAPRMGEVTLSAENYQRLTVPAGLWMAFQGWGEGLNLLLNLASIEHDPAEAMSCPLETFAFDPT